MEHAFLPSRPHAGAGRCQHTYIPRLTIDPIEAFRGVYTDDFYIVQFQDYGKAEAVFEADIARTLRFLYRRSEAMPANQSGRIQKTRNRLSQCRTVEIGQYRRDKLAGR